MYLMELKCVKSVGGFLGNHAAHHEQVLHPGHGGGPEDLLQAQLPAAAHPADRLPVRPRRAPYPPGKHMYSCTYTPVHLYRYTSPVHLYLYTCTPLPVHLYTSTCTPLHLYLYTCTPLPVHLTCTPLPYTLPAHPYTSTCTPLHLYLYTSTPLHLYL